MTRVRRYGKWSSCAVRAAAYVRSLAALNVHVVYVAFFRRQR
jgi:hypothetical protein